MIRGQWRDRPPCGAGGQCGGSAAASRAASRCRQAGAFVGALLSNYRVDPGQASLPQVVTARELREHRERLDTFMRIAREGVDRLTIRCGRPNTVCCSPTPPASPSICVRCPSWNANSAPKAFATAPAGQRWKRAPAVSAPALSIASRSRASGRALPAPTTSPSPAARRRSSASTTSPWRCSMPRPSIRPSTARPGAGLSDGGGKRV